MPISFYLLLSLVWITSFHPWHSQCLQLDDNKFEKQLQAPIKGKMGKMVVSWDEATIERMKLSPPKAGEDREIVRFKRAKDKRRRKQLKRILEELKKKVSWEVPHDDDDDDDHMKAKGNNGVFSSDYEHARTHPPSHN